MAVAQESRMALEVAEFAVRIHGAPGDDHLWDVVTDRAGIASAGEMCWLSYAALEAGVAMDDYQSPSGT